MLDLNHCDELMRAANPVTKQRPDAEIDAAMARVRSRLSTPATFDNAGSAATSTSWARRRFSFRPGLRLWSGGLPVLAIAATATAVAAAAVTLVITRPRGPASLLTRHVDLRALASASHTAQATDPTCKPASNGGPRITHATPDAAMLSAVPVLRRPATSADKLPARVFSQNVLRLVDQGGAVYVDYIRRTRVLDGMSFYLVPVSKLGPPPLALAQANRCHRLEVAALNAKLPTIPAVDRAATRRYGDAAFAFNRHNRETAKVHDAVFLLVRTADGGGFGTTGPSPAAIRRAGTLAEVSLPLHHRSPNQTVIAGVVPSGVATVTLRFPASGRGRDRLPALSVTGKVVNSTFAIVLPRRLGFNSAAEQRSGPTSATWRSATGKLIKTVNEPNSDG